MLQKGFLLTHNEQGFSHNLAISFNASTAHFYHAYSKLLEENRYNFVNIAPGICSKMICYICPISGCMCFIKKNWRGFRPLEERIISPECFHPEICDQWCVRFLSTSGFVLVMDISCFSGWLDIFYSLFVLFLGLLPSSWSNSPSFCFNIGFSLITEWDHFWRSILNNQPFIKSRWLSNFMHVVLYDYFSWISPLPPCALCSNCHFPYALRWYILLETF